MYVIELHKSAAHFPTQIKKPPEGATNELRQKPRRCGTEGTEESKDKPQDRHFPNQLFQTVFGPHNLGLTDGLTPAPSVPQVRENKKEKLQSDDAPVTEMPHQCAARDLSSITSLAAAMPTASNGCD
jgi:hypothetical protein